MLLNTGARIYEYYLPCLMLRDLLFNSIQKFEKITANENKMKTLTKLIYRKSIFLILVSNIFFIFF